MGNGDILERKRLSRDMKITLILYTGQQSKKGHIFVNEEEGS